MKILDRYILGKFFSSFFFCILLMTVIVVVVDISEKTDDFVKSGLSASRIMTDYYFGFIPRIDAMLFPLFVFIAVIFFTSKMAGRSEIIAIFSSGVSFNRFMFPYFVGGILLSGMLWAANQYVVPQANRKWADFDKKYIHFNMSENEKSTYKQNLYFRVDSNTYAAIRNYDTISKSGYNLSIQRFKNRQLVYNLRATNFKWDTLYKNWKLMNAMERTVQTLNEQNVLLGTTNRNLGFKPVDLNRDEYLKDQMPTAELNQYIKLERLRGSEMLNTLLVEKYNRDAIPVSVFILTLIGAVLASRKVRGGSGAHLALGVVISVSYIIFSRFSLVFATKGNFTPWLAAWTPNIIFGILAAYLYKKAPK